VIQLDQGLLKRIALLWLACCGAALLVDPQRWVISRPGLIESILWLAVLSVAAFTRQVPSFLYCLPGRHRRFLAAVLAAVLFGQLAGREPERTFPLVSWRMFSSKRALRNLTFFDYVGETANGQQITLNLPRLFPSVNHTVMMGLANLAEETVDDQTSAGSQRLSSALRAVGRMHNRLNQTMPVRSVSLVRCTLDASAPAADRHEQRQRILTVPVTGER
jgi:hypothetical protein